jgi:Putative excisionase (DUF1233)
MVHFVNKQALSQSIGISPHTMKRYRLSGKWIEGIHWQRLNARHTLYNLALIEDWISNRSQPEQHQVAIDNYLKALPSNRSHSKSLKKIAA